MLLRERVGGTCQVRSLSSVLGLLGGHVYVVLGNRN